MNNQIINKAYELFSNTGAFCTLKALITDLKTDSSSALESFQNCSEVLFDWNDHIENGEVGAIILNNTQFNNFKTVINNYLSRAMDSVTHQAVNISMDDNGNVFCGKYVDGVLETEQIALLSMTAPHYFTPYSGKQLYDITGQHVDLLSISRTLTNQFTESCMLDDVLTMIETGDVSLSSLETIIGNKLEGASDEAHDFYGKIRAWIQNFAISGDMSPILNGFRSVFKPHSEVTQNQVSGELTGPGYATIYSIGTWVWLKTGLDALLDIGSTIALCLGHVAISAVATIAKGVINVISNLTDASNELAISKVDEDGQSPLFSQCLFFHEEIDDNEAYYSGSQHIFGLINGFINLDSNPNSIDAEIKSYLSLYANPFYKGIFLAMQNLYDFYGGDLNNGTGCIWSSTYNKVQWLNLHMGSDNTATKNAFDEIADTCTYSGMYTKEEFAELTDQERLTRTWCAILLTYGYLLTFGYKIGSIPTSIWGEGVLTSQSTVRTDRQFSVFLEMVGELCEGTTGKSGATLRSQFLLNVSRHTFLGWTYMINTFIPFFRPFAESIMSGGLLGTSVVSLPVSSGTAWNQTIEDTFELDLYGWHHTSTNSLLAAYDWEYQLPNFEYMCIDFMPANVNLSKFSLLPPQVTAESVKLARIIAITIGIVAVGIAAVYTAYKFTNTRRQLKLAAESNQALEAYKSDPSKENFKAFKRANRKLSFNKKIFGECKYATAFAQSSFGWGSDGYTSADSLMDNIRDLVLDNQGSDNSINSIIALIK